MCTLSGSSMWSSIWLVTAWVLETFFDSRRSRSSMFLKSMLPPDVELVGVVEGQATVLEEAGQDAVHDGGARSGS